MVCQVHARPGAAPRPSPPCRLQDDWYRRAELALTKGEEDLARDALSRRKAYQVRAVQDRSALGAPPARAWAAGRVVSQWGDPGLRRRGKAELADARS